MTNQINFNSKHLYFADNYFYFIFLKYFYYRDSNNKLKFSFYSTYFFLDNASDYYVYKISTFLNIDTKVFWDFYTNFKKMNGNSYVNLTKKLVFFENFFKNNLNLDVKDYKVTRVENFSNNYFFVNELFTSFYFLNNFFNRKKVFYLKNFTLLNKNLKQFYYLNNLNSFLKLKTVDMINYMGIFSKKFFKIFNKKVLYVNNHRIYNVFKKNMFRKFKNLSKLKNVFNIIRKKKYRKSRMGKKIKLIGKEWTFRKKSKVKWPAFKYNWKNLKLFKILKRKLVIVLKFFNLFLKFNNYYLVFKNMNKSTNLYFKQRFFFYFIFIINMLEKVLRLNSTSFMVYRDKLKGKFNLNFIFLGNYLKVLFKNRSDLLFQNIKNKPVNYYNLKALNNYFYFYFNLFINFKNNYLLFSKFKFRNFFNQLNLNKTFDKFNYFLNKNFALTNNNYNTSLMNLYSYQLMTSDKFTLNYGSWSIIDYSKYYNYNYLNFESINNYKIFFTKYKNLKFLYDANLTEISNKMIFNKLRFFKDFSNLKIFFSHRKKSLRTSILRKDKFSLFFYKFWYHRKVYLTKKVKIKINRFKNR